MKAIKGVLLFCFLGGIVSSCFDQPQFSNLPKITFNNIQFKVTPDISDADSLIIYIDFKDGNGDLGLGANERNDPYHPRNFYFEAPGGKITPVGTVLREVNKPPYPTPIASIEAQATGKLVTNRTRKKQGYGYLPAFSTANLECRHYTTQYLLISPSARSSIDKSYAIVDSTLQDQFQNRFYLIKDTVYFEPNPNHYNIRVRFYQSTGGAFTEFSWEDNFCSQTMNGRFPILSDKTGPLEGTIRYAMASSGFLSLFSIKNLRLDIIVSDRALNKDSIRTPDFTLDKIRVN